MNNCLKTLALSIFFLSFLIPASFSQEILDSTATQDITAEDFNAEDSLYVSQDSMQLNVLPFDTTKVPAALLYSSWNNNFVNPYNIDLEKKPDTTIIDLKGYVHPIAGRITSNFGWRRWKWHYGIDLKLNVGDTLRSSFDGMVRIAKRSRSFGNFVVIRHNNGLETIYGHMARLMVSPNQSVKAGDVIGLGGNTGRSTGPHLHYEIRYMGNSINPNDIVNFDSCKLKIDTLKLCQNHFAYLTEIRKIRFHVVRSGDTLWKISRRYGVSIPELCRLNKISRKKILRLGQRIRYT
jgi:murein DD-endopeptidase MepM/ murein hydrolase activator NlpD